MLYSILCLSLSLCRVIFYLVGPSTSVFFVSVDVVSISASLDFICVWVCELGSSLFCRSVILMCSAHEVQNANSMGTRQKTQTVQHSHNKTFISWSNDYGLASASTHWKADEASLLHVCRFSSTCVSIFQCVSLLFYMCFVSESVCMFVFSMCTSMFACLFRVHLLHVCCASPFWFYVGPFLLY